MELSHLLNLVAELPQNTILNYVRGTDTCKFLNVDASEERIYSETSTQENKPWASSYLRDLAEKIKENIPFNLSGLLNNRGSYRPILETIIAHTREFYAVRKGSATSLVWIPSKPKMTLELIEINQDEIPAPVDSDTNEVYVAIMNKIKNTLSQDELIKELKIMVKSLGTTGVHLFGLKYGKFLKDKKVKELSQLAKEAGLTDNYGIELYKLINVYKAIHGHKFGVSFYDEIHLEHRDLSSSKEIPNQEKVYLRAMRTKPFLLLAGISGTGKSRIVKQMAFDSCPDLDDLISDPVTPGNYSLIEVKPNWHDSTELLGYESRIGGAHYQLTPFVKFLVKAMLYPEVPFFVCLDEMNLAPVEQYFAEFLSVLESRVKTLSAHNEWHILSEPLVKAEIFANADYELKLQDDLFGLELKEETVDDGRQRIISGRLSAKNQEVYDHLKEFGLRIPENVIVIGTVNMDETTHQFSRKVIDRAMTIEMNLPDGEPFMDFFNKPSELAYKNAPSPATLYLPTETKASDVLKELTEDNAEKTEWLKGEIAQFMTGLNNALDGTPFKVAYRVQNELMLYFYQLWLEDKTAKWRQILNTSSDQILMMKVLPRIEGDEELLNVPLERLSSFCSSYPNAYKKIEEMRLRLDRSRFTSFWP
jgi:hypothetical protein